MNNVYRRILILWLISMPAVAAEDAYVTSRDFRAGLHEDKTVSSPVMKLLPAGTRVQVIKKESAISYIKDEQGVSGWVDNNYLTAEAPSDSAQSESLREQVETLEAQLAEAAADTGSGRMSRLEQQLKQERLQAGELQVQLAELRKRVGVTGSNEALYDEIARIETENKKLQVALSAAGVPGGQLPEAAALPNVAGIIGTDEFIIGAAALLIIGCLTGIYLMDYRSRRRHGGFRI